MNLFKRLKHIGFDENNKALRSYMYNHLDGSYALRAIYDAAMAHPIIPDEDALSLALSCANKNLNGGQIAGMSRMWMKPREQIEFAISSTEQLLATYKATRKSTLEKYRLAAKVIDEYRS